MPSIEAAAAALATPSKNLEKQNSEKLQTSVLFVRPEQIWEPNEPPGVVDIVQESKEYSSEPLDETSSVVQELWSNHGTKVGKDWREEEGGQTDNAKDKSILLRRKENNPIVFFKSGKIKIFFTWDGFAPLLSASVG